MSAELPIAGLLQQEGEGNFHRVLTGQGVDNQHVLELAAGSRGRISYTQEVIDGSDARGYFHLQFLSTQGTGKVVFEALDDAKKSIATVVWLVTGTTQPANATTAVIDKRSSYNFRGDWIKAEWNVRDLVKNMIGTKLPPATSYRLSIIAGEGQHVLIRDARFSSSLIGNIKITPLDAKMQAPLGEQLIVAADIENIGREPLPTFQVGIWCPYAYSLLVEGPQEYTVGSLPPGGKTRLSWTLRAQRPDLVNAGKPWPVAFTVNSKTQGAIATVAVPDHRPGKLLYVMTEDLEPIDSAGYDKAWGNADGWLNPEEFRVQLIQKAETLNRIAEQHGAKWTHYIAWPAVRAAEWASAHSTSGEWGKVIKEVRQSVSQQAARGHEYALHLHSDYDPDLPENVLSYQPQTDGFWANHLRHGWAHSVLREGDFDVYDSRTGMLYYYQRQLDQLAQDSGQGQLLTARVGSFDFGDGDADEAMSTRAYRRVGLWGSSDADGNIGGVTSAPYGQEIYLARFDDINSASNSPETAGLVEFRPTPKQKIMYDLNSAVSMNTKTDQGVVAFSEDGQIKPGVHAVIGFTHAMFMMGDGDWRSLEGGQFSQLNDHLRYVKCTYADSGLLQFATATQLVTEYLDYYSPVPVAIYGEKLRQGSGETEYAITILGKDIPVSVRYPHFIKVKLPLYLRDSALYVQVLKNGVPVYSTWATNVEDNDIPFIADDRSAQYTLKVYYDEELAAFRQSIQQWWKAQKWE